MKFPAAVSVMVSHVSGGAALIARRARVTFFQPGTDLCPEEGWAHMPGEITADGKNRAPVPYSCLGSFLFMASRQNNREAVAGYYWMISINCPAGRPGPP
jgi:hypothetical protein